MLQPWTLNHSYVVFLHGLQNPDIDAVLKLLEFHEGAVMAVVNDLHRDARRGIESIAEQRAVEELAFRLALYCLLHIFGHCLEKGDGRLAAQMQVELVRMGVLGGVRVSVFA